jgi:diaminopimelate decarboxylase
MKPRYERPLMVRHSLGGANKFGAPYSIPVRSHLEGIAVATLVEKYGSPLFVFSERILRARYRELRDQLAHQFDDFTLAWSYKTNYLGAICRVFHQEGAWAEVVSGLELRKALAMGVPGRQIIFNGPAKREADLELAFREGAVVQIDHLDELAVAEKVAERLSLAPSVGMRVNVREVPVPSWDRFGFNLETGRALEAARRIVRTGRLRLNGLHCHLGTFILDPDAYRLAAAAVGRFAIALEREIGVAIDWIDLGGGFASHNTLHNQYLPGEEVTPSFGQYVEAIASGLDEAFAGKKLPRLVVETGRALVDDAGYLISSILGNKRLSDGRKGVILDAGVNLLPTAWWYRHDVFPAQACHGTSEPTVFFGPLCMNIDVVRDRILFPPLSVGSHVVIAHVGAYNVTQWMQFITERPNVILISPSGDHGTIRRAEGLEALLLQEEMPAWLQA